MAHQAESRDSTHNVIGDSEVHGPVVQAGNNGSIIYFIRNGLRRADVVGTVLLTALMITAGLLVPGMLDDDRPAADDAKSTPGKPVADADVTAWGCGESAVVPELKVGAQGMAPLPAFPRGGIRASGSSISIVLQGSSDEELLLTGARAEIITRHRPARGGHIVNPCGSDAPKRVFTVDLDRDAPELKAIPDQSIEAGAREFKSWPYAVKHGDAEYFVVRPQSAKYDTEFRLVLFWSSGGHKGRLTLDDQGKPFRVTATSAADPTCVTVRSESGYWLMPAHSKTCKGAG
ncbi:hypothetical protein [Streptomyces dubilierae]|uniref:Uncharacterized protein n=1 Tax=Streptomyces dubilierae TaxID=3075533 RepID=A0ABU2P1G5_9ACTN|nr:hypothetical protein [Streptomyces sp. DSM 41921]MDT0385974.1 hypothetical protein [Streptomyces sp. DSM 41921]